jgi:hypothetical protein
MGDTKDAMESENVYTKQQRIAKHADLPFSSIAKPFPEEPYASITLVRICGGLGG